MLFAVENVVTFFSGMTYKKILSSLSCLAVSITSIIALFRFCTILGVMELRLERNWRFIEENPAPTQVWVLECVTI